MEMTRTRIRLMLDEEDWDRRISPRNRKRARYIEDDDYEEVEDDDSEEEEEEDDEDNEQPGPSAQKTTDQKTQSNKVLTVTCGKKTGILNVDKLDRGEECIMCEDRWFSPPAFEDFGGKGSSRKWKASISYDNKPLQFWFEQGSLTTKGFKRRGTKAKKQRKILSSNCMSDSFSEESEKQSAEETEEDDVHDEDWLPGSDELVLETKEERAVVENRGEVVEDEDKMEKGEMEDEDTAAVADNDDSVSEEREAKQIITTLEARKSALQKKAKVIVKRLPEFQAKNDRQSSCMEHPSEDGWCESLVEGALTEEERKHHRGDRAATLTDPSQVSDPSMVGDAINETGVKFTQSKGDAQKEMKIETGIPAEFLSAEATSLPDIKAETEDIGSTNNHIADHSSSVVLSVALRHTDFDPCIDEWEESGQPFTSGHISDATSAASQRGIKMESIEAMYGGTSATSESVLVECKYENTDATTSGHEAAELQGMELARVPQTSRASDHTQSSRPSTSCDLDTMDLDQLRREKIKMQIKVLRLQEEYYTQKIKEQKN